MKIIINPVIINNNKMKKIILLLIIVITTLSVNAQESINYGIITGKIKNVEGFTELAVSKAFGKYQHMVKLNKEGEFIDTIRTNSGRYTFYEAGGKNATQIYFDKGDKIHVTYDAKDYKNTLKFTGKGSGASAFMVKSDKKHEELSKNNNWYSLKAPINNIADAKKNIEETKAIYYNMLKAEKGLSKNFIAQEKRNINAIGMGNLLDKHLEFGDVEKMMKHLVFSDEFLKELETGIDWNNAQDAEDLLSVLRIRGFYIGAQGTKIGDKKNVSMSRGSIEFIKTGIQNKEVKGDLYFNSFMMLLREEDDITGLYKEFMALGNSEKNKSEFKRIYEETLPMAKGQPSPKFENYENYAGGTTSLDDFKGKFVYIDLWATWCGPCKDEIPSLKALEKEYHGKNIQFVSISCDKQKMKPFWKKMVKDLGLTGVQLIADKDFKSSFVKAYNAMSIPRFILIDPQGKIIKNNAPRPSETKKIKALFNANGI